MEWKVCKNNKQERYGLNQVSFGDIEDYVAKK